MTHWRIVAKSTDAEPTLVEPAETYLIHPGDAHLYGVGDVPSPKREAPRGLIRVEGENLDRGKRSNSKTASRTGVRPCGSATDRSGTRRAPGRRAGRPARFPTRGTGARLRRRRRGGRR